MQTIHRAGSFFILVGLALFLMFIASVMSREMHVSYLFFSLLSFITAFLFLRTRKSADSGRFRVLRQARERRQSRAAGNKPAKPGGLFGLGRRQSRKDRKREEETQKSEQP